MPELPEVETVRRGLEPHLVGARIQAVRLNRPDLRFAFPDKFADRLTGHTIISVSRRAKYLLIELSSGETWLSHLGMTGNFAIANVALAAPSHYRVPDNAGKHDHVQLMLSSPSEPALSLTYTDPRRFGFMDMFTKAAECAYLDKLGPEPLGNTFTAQSLATKLQGRRTPIKSALLDQRNVAGLGNIYVCEALWRTHIAPTMSAGQLVTAAQEPTPQLDALVRAIRDVLNAAIAAGGSTLKDFKNAEGASGYFQHNFDVYDREGQPCHTKGCSGFIERITQSGRSTFFCPACQGETG